MHRWQFGGNTAIVAITQTVVYSYHHSIAITPLSVHHVITHYINAIMPIYICTSCDCHRHILVNIPISMATLHDIIASITLWSTTHSYGYSKCTRISTRNRSLQILDSGTKP